MARELCDLIEAATSRSPDAGLLPCGPSAGTRRSRRLNSGGSLRGLTVFHMDECLDWQGGCSAQSPTISAPYGTSLYGGILPELGCRTTTSLAHPHRENVRRAISEAAVDITIALGQTACCYNQTRRTPIVTSRSRSWPSRHSHPENNIDTVLASLSVLRRGIPVRAPMSITLGSRVPLGAQSQGLQ